MLYLSESITKAPGVGIAYVNAWDATWQATHVMLFRYISDIVQFGVAGSTVISLHPALTHRIARNLYLI
jgi:hypothetical protein